MCFLDATFMGCFEMFADAGTSVSSRLIVGSFNHSGRSRKLFPADSWLPVFLFWDPVGFPIPLRHFVNLLDSKKCLMRSCGNRHEIFRLAQNPFPTLGQLWLFTAGHSYEQPRPSQSFPSDRTHLSCCKVSSCVLSFNFGAHALRS